MELPRKPHVGLVPIYVDYYEELDESLGQSKREFVLRLREELESGLHVSCLGVALTVEQAATMARELSAMPVDVLIVIPTVAAFGAVSLAACTQSDLPLIVLHAAEKETLLPDYTMAQMVSHSGGLGLQALCNSLTRIGRPFTVCVGSLCQRFFIQRVIEQACALAIPAFLQRCRLGVIGKVFGSMTDIALDLEHLEAVLGLRSVTLSTDVWKSAFHQVEAERVTELVEEVKSSFIIKEITRDELERSARLALSLDDLVAANGIEFGALNSHGSNCLDDAEIGIMATLGVSRLTSRGIPFAEVGDAPTAVAMAIGKLLGGTSIYAELDVVDYCRESWFIANSGELDFSAASPAEPIYIRGNENFKGRRGRGASFDAVIKEGPATLLSFTPTPQGTSPYRLVAARGEITNERFNDFHSVHGLMKVRSAEKDFRSWCEAGAVHHAALITSDIMPQLETLCRAWKPIEFVAVN